LTLHGAPAPAPGSRTTRKQIKLSTKLTTTYKRKNMAGDSGTNAVADTNQSCPAARQDIINWAKGLIGSHYLWGSDGGHPGLKDGMFDGGTGAGTVTMATSNTSPANPVIFAAQCTRAGTYVCAGRFQEVPGGRYCDPDDHDALVEYLKGLKTGDEANWPCYCKFFTPRMVQGSGVPSAGKIVWGEDCRNKQHFDCISFVNYCYSKNVTNWVQHWEIWQWDNKTCGSIEIPLNASSMMAADVLIRYDKDGTTPKTKEEYGVTHNVCTHIGMFDGGTLVVQAEQASKGVHADEVFVASKWDAARRIPCTRLLGS